MHFNCLFFSKQALKNLPFLQNLGNFSLLLREKTVMPPHFNKDVLCLSFPKLYLKYRQYVYKHQLADKPKEYLRNLQIEAVKHALKEHLRFFALAIEQRFSSYYYEVWQWKQDVREGYMKEIKLSEEVLNCYSLHKDLKKLIHRYHLLLKKYHRELCDFFEAPKL
jgi:hypothetical protein